MRVIKKLPKKAIFDYITKIGDKRYHSKKRIYMVEDWETDEPIVRSYNNNLY